MCKSHLLLALNRHLGFMNPFYLEIVTRLGLFLCVTNGEGIALACSTVTHIHSSYVCLLVSITTEHGWLAKLVGKTFQLVNNSKLHNTDWSNPIAKFFGFAEVRIPSKGY